MASDAVALATRREDLNAARRLERARGPSFRIRGRPDLRLGIAEALIQLRKALFQHRNIFRADGLELTQVILVDVRDLARFNGSEELDQPVSFLVPTLRTHKRLHV